MEVKLLRPSVFHAVGEVMDVPECVAEGWFKQRPPRAEPFTKTGKKPAADPEPAEEPAAAELVPEPRGQEKMVPDRSRAKKGPWK